MDYNDIRNVICAVVDCSPCLGDKNAILFKFSLKGDGFKTVYYEVLISVSSNYKHVFYRKSEGFHSLQRKEWIFACCHDSCWRTDGLQWVFDEWMNGRRDDMHDDFREMNFELDIFSFFKFVWASIKRDPNVLDNSYFVSYFSCHSSKSV